MLRARRTLMTCRVEKCVYIHRNQITKADVNVRSCRWTNWLGSCFPSSWLSHLSVAQTDWPRNMDSVMTTYVMLNWYHVFFSATSCSIVFSSLCFKFDTCFLDFSSLLFVMLIAVLRPLSEALRKNTEAFRRHFCWLVSNLVSSFTFLAPADCCGLFMMSFTSVKIRGSLGPPNPTQSRQIGVVFPQHHLFSCGLAR